MTPTLRAKLQTTRVIAQLRKAQAERQHEREVDDLCSAMQREIIRRHPRPRPNCVPVAGRRD